MYNYISEYNTSTHTLKAIVVLPNGCNNLNALVCLFINIKMG